MKATETDTLPAESHRDADRVLKILARWDEKMRGRQTQKRSQERCAYPARMSVYHHEIKTRPGRSAEAAPISVWARNVSALGVGFIYKGQIPAKRVVLCLDPDAGAKTWLLVEIVRRRQVHNEFWDYGAKFIGRATPEDAKRTTRAKTDTAEQVE
ncbi:MAG TPA: hypothetical protein VFG04_11165 [Planctomycetaceae bacterium]|nr:hypothetical protein [Planctomycetaceae bacterium]